MGIAIELLAACQAIEFLRPMKTTVPLEEVYRVVRSAVRPWDKDRFMAPDIENATNLLKDGKIWSAVKDYVKLSKITWILNHEHRLRHRRRCSTRMSRHRNDAAMKTTRISSLTMAWSSNPTYPMKIR